MSSEELFDRVREQNGGRSLDEKDVLQNPYTQFKLWFEDAVHAEIMEPTAMVLATATPEGVPSARVVLMKSFDDNGFVFYTNYDSRKGSELEKNPHAALLFFWVELGRQVRVEGVVRKTSEEKSVEYFATRPHDSRIGAWASQQSQIIASRSELEAKFQEYAAKFKEREIPKPDRWGGFTLEASRFEFWQGRESRLHDRIVYKRKENEWEIVRLAP
ncbi:MAG: pyridoxamine 5'-phosphate oxidase [Bacteroidota bacterium]